MADLDVGRGAPCRFNSKRRAWLPLFRKSSRKQNTLFQLEIKALRPVGRCDITVSAGKNYTGKEVFAEAWRREDAWISGPKTGPVRTNKKCKTSPMPRHLPKVNRGGAEPVRFSEKTGQEKRQWADCFFEYATRPARKTTPPKRTVRFGGVCRECAGGIYSISCTTSVTSGTMRLSIPSMPDFSVTVEDGQPLHEPCMTTWTRPAS